MQLLLFLFKSGLPEEEILDVITERSEKYRHVKGLIQKFYVQDNQSNHIGGVFVFDSKQNMQLFRDSELAQSTRDAYKFIGTPIVRVLEITRALITNTVMTLQE